MDTVFSTRVPARNKALKQPLIANMTGSIQEFHSSIDQSIRTFIQAMHNGKGQSTNLAHWTQYWAFDLMRTLVLGREFGFMEYSGDIRDIVQNFNTSVRVAALLGQVPEWYSWTLGNNTFTAFLNSVAGSPDVVTLLLRVC